MTGRERLRTEVVQAHCEARAAGRRVDWGHRFAGRFAEWGFRSDFETAETLVDMVLKNWQWSVDAGRRSAVVWRITELTGRPTDPEHPRVMEAEAAALVRASTYDRLAWDACALLSAGAIASGVTPPGELRTWAAARVLEPDGPSRRPKAPPRDPDDLAARNSAIVAAVRLALASGAFAGATHRDTRPRRVDDPARSAAELVADRLPLVRVAWGVDFAGVARIWSRASDA